MALPVSCQSLQTCKSLTKQSIKKVCGINCSIQQTVENADQENYLLWQSGWYWMRGILFLFLLLLSRTHPYPSFYFSLQWCFWKHTEDWYAPHSSVCLQTGTELNIVQYMHMPDLWKQYFNRGNNKCHLLIYYVITTFLRLLAFLPQEPPGQLTEIKSHSI